ncbi:hypothetical protein CK203_108805 [Vitis vinifera]|uniref:Uncharacterized protein n=1 Tax=Vitis vinifera TaxID=29760 RepID=A0A438BPA0_VITVI|nr:hypothetical protein CK203_108805 [Vitis vinifera]
MEIPHEDQSSHYDHEKDKFSYLSMRDRIELGKRQVQQSQWGSKYALNGDDSYKHAVGECPTIPTVRDMYGYQSSYTSSWNNHLNLTTQPQPQPSMSTSSLEQAILKINKVMEDFVGEQQKINSHLNEKIDNLESSINVRMEGVYNDLSLRIEKVQDSIEKLTNLDIARGKRKLPPQPHHNLQGTNAKRSRKVLKIDTLVGIAMTTLWTNLPLKIIRFKMTKGYLNPLKHPLLQGREEKRIPLDQMGRMPILFGIQGEFSMKWVCMMLAKIKVMMINTGEAKNRGKQGRKAKTEQFAPPISATVGPISISYRSSFHAYYMSFQILGIQESIASNGARFGVETKKLWPFEDDCAKLNGNVATAPILLLLDTFLEHFLELKLCIPYLFLKLRKSGVQWFKWCAIWI